MPLIALGLNHRTAPVALREQVAIDADATAPALAELARQPGVDEALILSTCNRTELYCSVHEGAEDAPAAWLHARNQMTPGRLDEFLYRHTGVDAVRHVFRVATGLESMVLGEPQILGQVKDAWRAARSAHTLHAPMDRLLQNAFAVAKRVRTETRIGTGPVSVAFTAVRLVEQAFTELSEACVLLIGAGDTIELATRHLVERGVKRLIVANRTIETAQALVNPVGGYAIALAELPRHLAEADIVISATASRDTILDSAMLRDALRQRRRRPMLLMDLAVPRDIDPAAAKLPDVFLYTIDDLQQTIESGRRSRQASVREAEAIIDLQVERYLAWRRAAELDQPLRAYRASAEAQRDEVLARARDMLAAGHAPAEALDYLAHTLTGKLLHVPSVHLREAAEHGDQALLDAAARLFDTNGHRP
ncbi:MAG TPA: glutamyl-tRNA reductase [Rhodanobacteraceae bacterium]|nr:glutamyl-tRNA reductase [Rhodanobacteraceae bacterium]